MTRFIVIRHGETHLNLEDVFQGWIDSELTEKGLEQASKLADRLKEEKIDVIYSSPFERALKTAEIVRGTRKLPLVTDERFKEIKCGRWEGFKFLHIKDKYPLEYGTWDKTPHLHKMPEGETFYEVFDRAKSGMEEILRENKGKTILISTHMVTTLLIMTYFGGEGIDQLWNTPKQGNTALNIVDVDDKGGFSIILRGDDSHLKDMGVKYKFWEIGSAQSCRTCCE